ncbi:hypothetical protein CLOM_g1509, partial [Closterium sp. NIES-68]
LEVAVNHLLYLRSIYPPEIFHRSRFASVPVYCSRHPGLRCYIRDAINDLSPHIDKGVVERIDLAVFATNGMKIYERIVFDFSVFPSASAASSAAQQDSLESIEYCLRSFLVKASVSECLQRPLPQDCAWELIAHSKHLPSGRSSSGQFWIQADSPEGHVPNRPTPAAAAAPAFASADTVGAAGALGSSVDWGSRHVQQAFRGASTKVPRLLPIKSMNTGALSLQLYVERP